MITQILISFLIVAPLTFLWAYLIDKESKL